jgi:hypothetical protein
MTTNISEGESDKGMEKCRRVYNFYSSPSDTRAITSRGVTWMRRVEHVGNINNV